MNELAGLTLGGYYLEEEVGHGAMGVVYRGRQLALDREVAIKVLPQSLARDANYVARFTREARIMADLNHPNIVQIYDAGRQNKHLFFVMEFVHGPTLANLIYLDGIIPPHLAIEYAAQIAEALDAAYRERNVIHRDIKPENLMLNHRGTIKVMDFGLARAPGLQAITVAQTLVGSIYYASPEQIWGMALDNRSDIYALGVVLYQMVSGRRPYEASSMQELTQIISSGHLDSPRKFNPEISQALERIILTALARDRDQRYDDADLMAQDLHTLMNLSGSPSISHRSISGTPRFNQPFVQPPRRPQAQRPISLDVESIEHTKTQPLVNKTQQAAQQQSIYPHQNGSANRQQATQLPYLPNIAEEISQQDTQQRRNEYEQRRPDNQTTRRIIAQPTVEMPSISKPPTQNSPYQRRVPDTLQQRENTARQQAMQDEISQTPRSIWKHLPKRKQDRPGASS